MSQPEKQIILIVDDAPENIDVLVGILEGEYKIKAALDGEKALKIAASENPPDLILLDIMMPGTDGYQVCRQLKQNKATRGIPVIFVTAKAEEENETKGFDIGAVDYITKPVKPAVVKARVKTQIELKLHRDHMEALAEARAQQLMHADRLSTLGTLSAGVAHEINNPLMYISGNAEIIMRDIEEFQAELAQALDPASPHKEILDAKLKDCRESISNVLEGSFRIESLVRNMRHLSRRDDEVKTKIDLDRCVERAVNLCQFDLKRIHMHLDMENGIHPVMGNAQQIEQVLINLFRNAADALAIVKSPELSLTVKRDEGDVHISLTDNGPGISEDKLSAIWEAFYTTKTDEKGTGLGLSISKSIIEDHGGRIWAENMDPQGACFNIELPLVN